MLRPVGKGITVVGDDVVRSKRERVAADVVDATAWSARAQGSGAVCGAEEVDA